MPRPATGSVRYESGRWKARITVDGRKRLVDIEPPIRSKADRDKAIEAAKRISAMARDPARFAQVGAAGMEKELARDWFGRWAAEKEERGQRSVDAVRAHFKGFVDTAIGSTPMALVSREQLEALVQSLDRKVSIGEISWKYASNIWGTVTKAFDDASEGKVLELRCRDDNPAAKVRGPYRGVETEQVHLFPSEFMQLVTCASVPVFRRRYYTIAIYCYLRPGELEALAWSDIDLAREIVHVRHGMDRKTDEVTAPKAKRARAPFTIEPALLPLLRAMHKESGGVGRVVGDVGDERKLSEILRRDLATAGVTRAELHESSKKPPREWMVMHGCRHTGVTWMAVRGDEPLMIMARAGHADIKTTLSYVNRAALIRKAYGTPFPSLPKALLKRVGIGRGLGREIAAARENKAISAEAHGNRIERGSAAYAVRRRIALVKSGEVPGSTPSIPAEVDGSAQTPAQMSRQRKLVIGRFAAALRQAILEERFEHARNLLNAIDDALPLTTAAHAGPAAPTGAAGARSRSPRP